MSTNLFFTDLKPVYILLQLNTHTNRKRRYLLHRDVTPLANFQMSLLRLLQLSLFTSFKYLLVYFLISSSSPGFPPIFLVSPQSLSNTSVFILLSDKPFVGCNPRHCVLSCSQVLSLCFYVPLSSRGPQGKPSPPLS